MTDRDKSGKWKPGQSGNPGGRSGETQAIRAKLAKGATAVTTKVLEAAKGGDMQACRLILERLVPPIKPTSEPVQFELDDTDLPSAARSILRAVAAGQIAPDQGKSLIEGLGAVARVIEVAELQKAVEELREQMEGMQR
ncbi:MULTISPECIES: DUF5681 domain-containing protein [unclassified Pseudomonas]|uniref:DUF5681 domain-containing protein n=1 Tax=unclassified Pseudomonas TaxID=196821 RepID=UPI000CD2833C|nr:MULTISPECIES: DUF5681 domain-containing protein [unclassified Pseudomonas]MCU1750078.1 hypothetical protein [Pseudomonas sp. 6D_7.1_Bac1]POA28618.1 hypothetical protein C1887_22605 [Pseudomonas sp. GW456-R21]POA64495.1 hypothetical protein C1884_21035 [Pseudomonas sp. GW460-R15]